MRYLVTFLLSALCFTAATAQKSDSTIYHKLKTDPAVLEVYYHTDYWKNGIIKSEGWVYQKKVNGRKHYFRYGSWKEYYKTGVQIVQAHFPADAGWIEFKRWDIMGNKEFESRIQVGSANEFAVSNLSKEFQAQNYHVKYFVNNQLESAGNFKNGQKDGTWKYYGRTGIVVKQEIYFNGGLLSTRRTEPTPTLTKQRPNP